MSPRWDSSGVVRSVEAKADKGSKAAAKAIASELTRTLSKSGGGVPSRPGQPPHRQSGALARAVGVAQARAGMQAGIVDASQLTKARVLAAKRPFVPPTMRRVRGRLMGEFVRAAKR